MKIRGSDLGREELFVTIALCVVAVAMPMNYRLGFYSLIALALAAVFFAVKRKRIYRPPFFIQCLMILFFIRVLWVFKANDLRSALQMLEIESSLLLLPLIFSLFDISVDKKKSIALAFIIMGACTCIFVFVKLVIHFNGSGLPWREYLVLHFENAPYNSMQNILTWRSAHYTFITVMIIYGLHLLVYLDIPSKRSKVIGVILYTFLAIFLIVITGSNAGWFLLAAAFASYLSVHFKLLEKPWLVFAAAIFSCIMLLVSTGPYYRKWEPARFAMLSIAADAWKAKPWLGYGTGSGEQVMHNEDFEYNYSYTVNHPHNQYLTELIQFGVIGSIPFFLFVASSLWYAVKNRNEVLFAVLVTAIIFMWVEAPLNSNKGLVPFVFLLCFAVKGTADLKHVKTV